jgi:hypothetical protein
MQSWKDQNYVEFIIHHISLASLSLSLPLFINKEKMTLYLEIIIRVWIDEKR